MRWAGFTAGLLGVLSCVGFARAEPVGSATGDLPIAVASFPAEASPIAPAKVDLTSTPPSATSAAPPVATPSLTAPSTMDVPSAGEGATYCVESPTVLELGVLSLVRMIEEGAGLFAVARVGGPSTDERAFDDAAARELRRLTFMRRLAQMHEEENAREFSEKLSAYMRKREFLQALETRHLAPSPFERR